MEAVPQQYDGVPDAVTRYAQRRRHGSTVVEAWVLHVQGGLNAVQVSERVGVHPETVRRWFRELKKLVGATGDSVEDGRGAQAGAPLAVSLIDADMVARERAELYADAKRDGKAERQMRILDSEQRRLGLDVQRVEQVSLQVQLSMMPPEERQAEIARRAHRMMMRGRLDVAELLDANGDRNAHTRAREGVASPPSPSVARGQSDRCNHTPNSDSGVPQIAATAVDDPVVNSVINVSSEEEDDGPSRSA
jgi:hypothetical protein